MRLDRGPAARFPEGRPQVSPRILPPRPRATRAMFGPPLLRALARDNDVMGWQHETCPDEDT